MRPEEVPTELANLGADGLYAYLSRRPGPPERPMPPGYIARARAVLAAALPERARSEWAREWADAGLERLELERDQTRTERDALKAVVDEAVDHMLKIAAWGIHDSKRPGLRTIALAIRAVAAGETTVDEMRATVERLYTSEAPGGES